MDATPGKAVHQTQDTGKHRRNKKAKVRDALVLKSLQVPINVYGLSKKLLIFDINKVLLYRKAKTSYFTIRPYAHEFIASMAQRFILAVWTSMTSKSAKSILQVLFPLEKIPVLFRWYQPRCKTIECENKEDKPLFLKELWQVWKEYPQYNESNTVS